MISIGPGFLEMMRIARVQTLRRDIRLFRRLANMAYGDARENDLPWRVSLPLVGQDDDRVGRGNLGRRRITSLVIPFTM